MENKEKVDIREEMRNQAMRETYLREAIRSAIERIASLRPDLVLGITPEDKEKMQGFEKVDLTQNYQDWVNWGFGEIKKLQQAGSIADDIIVAVAEEWKNEKTRTSENK